MGIRYRCAGQGAFSNYPIFGSFGSCANVIDGTDYPAYSVTVYGDPANIPGFIEVYSYVLIEFYDDTTSEPIVVDGTVEFQVTGYGTWYPELPCTGSVGWGIPRGSAFSYDDIVLDIPIPFSVEDEDPTYQDVAFEGQSKYAFYVRGRVSTDECPLPPDYPYLEDIIMRQSVSILELCFSDLRLPSLSLPPRFRRRRAAWLNMERPAFL